MASNKRDVPSPESEYLRRKREFERTGNLSDFTAPARKQRAEEERERDAARERAARPKAPTPGFLERHRGKFTIGVIAGLAAAAKYWPEKPKPDYELLKRKSDRSRGERRSSLPELPQVKTPDFAHIIKYWHGGETGFRQILGLVQSYCDGEEGRWDQECVSTLMGVAKRESNGNPKSTSKAGAKGVWQVMPRASREFERAAEKEENEKYDEDIIRRRDAGRVADGEKLEKDNRYCLDRAATELKSHFERFGRHMALALVGYNMGPRDLLPRWLPKDNDKKKELFARWILEHRELSDEMKRGPLEKNEKFLSDVQLPRMQELFNIWLASHRESSIDLKNATSQQLWDFVSETGDYSGTMAYAMGVIDSEKVIAKGLHIDSLSYVGGELPRQIRSANRSVADTPTGPLPPPPVSKDDEWLSAPPPSKAPPPKPSPRRSGVRRTAGSRDT